MARSNLKEYAYDCLLIYDHEESSFSHRDTREDNSLLSSYVNFVDHQLKSCNYKIHHLDRDSIPGRSVFYELERVIESSKVILLILDKGFFKNSWKCFSQEAAIKNLIDASTDPKCTTSNRLIPIFIRLNKNEIPPALKTLTPIEIMGESDIIQKWNNLKIAIGCHFGQETLSRSIEAENPLASLQNYPQGTSVPQYASAVSREPRVNPINNGPSSRSAIIPIPITVNTPDSASTGERIYHRPDRTRESENNQPITQISSETQGRKETSINGSTLLNQEPLEGEHVTIPRALQSSDVETDAPYSLNPREAEILQVKNISSTVSPTSSVSDSGIGLDSSLSLHEISSVFPSLLNNDLESAVNYTPNHENSYCDAHLNKPDTTEKRRVPDGLTTGNHSLSFENDSGTPQDRVDMANTDAPSLEGFTSEEKKKPSIYRRGLHILIHALFLPDRVYEPL